MHPKPAAWLLLTLLLLLTGACRDDRAPAATSPSRPSTLAAPADPVLASVAGTTIHKSQVEQELQRALQARAQLQPTRSDAWRQRKRQQLLDGLIDQALLKRALQDEGIAIEDDAVDARLQQQLTRIFHTEEALDRHLQQTGRDRAAFREQLRFELGVERLLDARSAADPVTDDDIRAYYQAHPDRFTTPARVHLAALLLRVPPDATPAQLDDLQRRADALAREARAPGASFAALAARHSESPTAPRGGDLGWSEPQDLDPALTTLAFQLPVGATSDPIRTRQGLQLLHVIARHEPGPRPLHEVRDALDAQLQSRRDLQRRASLLRQLRERYPVVP